MVEGVTSMYESLKEWIDVPVTIKPFKKRSGTGSVLFKEPIDTYCYPRCDVKTITNWHGEEVVSNRQLYLDGKEAISNVDVVIFEGEELPVQNISTFYRNGAPDLKVVYV